MIKQVKDDTNQEAMVLTTALGDGARECRCEVTKSLQFWCRI